MSMEPHRELLDARDEDGRAVQIVELTFARRIDRPEGVEFENFEPRYYAPDGEPLKLREGWLVGIRSHRRFRIASDR